MAKRRKQGQRKRDLYKTYGAKPRKPAKGTKGAKPVPAEALRVWFV